MAAPDSPILIELHQRIREALRSIEAMEAPPALRRALWMAAGILHRMLVAPPRRRKSPKADEIRDAIRFVDQTLDLWAQWLRTVERQQAEGTAR